MRIARPLVIVWLVALAIGCHAQIPPTSESVALTWTAPSASGTWAGCTTANPCSYAISRATLTAGTTTCPATTGTAYTPLNQSSPATGTSYTDTGAVGLTVCYIAQTEQTAGACSAATPCVSTPSNSAGPFVVPGNPVAPVLTGNTQAKAELTTDEGQRLARATSKPGTVGPAQDLRIGQ